MKIRHIFTLAVAALSFNAAGAAEPSGYYDSCAGKGGKDLLSALNKKVASHTNVGYDGLWNVYKTSDVRPNGTVWDMYSTKEWPSNFTKCGNYSNVGDCVNREHSFPKSWWGGSKQDQYSDAYHLYPTDGKVNGQRSNYPFGECANGTSLASNGNVKPLGKLGTCTFPGYTGKVFEPDDQYKGDFARTYFYLAAAYNTSISGWTQGEASNVIAGNTYPVFKDWVVNLLLKWHREDPVSDKETTRNDAVYAHQKNRNPFIDHPEMVEYIWGDKKDQKWNGDAAPDGEIVLPVNGSTIDMGLAGKGVPVSKTIEVRGSDLTGAVSVAATNGLQLSATTISASHANEGTELTITWTLNQTGSYTSKLTFTSGSAKSEVTVKAVVQDGLPVAAATEITAESFRANWTYVGDATDGKYTLDVRHAGESIDGYPRAVAAEDGHYTVDGLEASTTYTYVLKSATMTSDEVTVTTGQLLPYIEFLYDGELAFTCAPGVPSAAEELLVVIENVEGKVNVSVTAPFQISTDKNDWSTSLQLDPAEDRMYMRLAADRAGSFTTEIVATAGDYTSESGTIHGVCVDPSAGFLEDFEANFAKTYTDGEYVGTAAKWMFNNVGVVGTASQGDRIYAGEKSCRFGNNTDSSIAMAEDLPGGAGTVSFYACRWVNNQGKADADAEVAVKYSIDGGASWELAGTVAIDNTEYRQFSVAVNMEGPVRIKIEQTSGKRIHLDDVAITSYTLTGLNNPDADYYTWDAFSATPGILTIESRHEATVAVHGVDGITYVGATGIAAGTNEFELPAGLYIVVVGDDTRRVLVK
ncbi:MAG: endonuclease [Muribaculaceae bacterium]|nr:endonuclease [Muribaculaceae bacterium]